MKKYYYDVDTETFKRSDRRGMPLYVNIVEAHRIIGLLDVGSSVQRITEKVQLSHPKGTVSTVKSFVRNYKANNIDIPDDAPVPSNIFDEMTEESRMDDLERRIEKLESVMFESNHTVENNGFVSKVKSWIS